MSDIESDLTEARQALSDEDLHGTLAWIEIHLHDLRALDSERAAEVLGLYAPVLEAWSGDEVAALAREAAGAVDDPDLLYRTGLALVEAKELEPAIGVLGRALARASERGLVARVVHELCAAEELLGRFSRSASWIDAAPGEVRALPMSRYLFAFARFMERDPEPARAVAPELAASADERIAFMGQRLLDMLARHEGLAPLLAEGASQGQADRVWHAITTGEAIIDPRGQERETLASVRSRIAGLAASLPALGFRAQVVTAPADRDSRILGHAAAEVLGLPFVVEGPLEALSAVVTVWDLGALAESDVAALRASVPGHLLYVHAGRVDEEMPLAADLVGVGAGGGVTGRGALRVPWGHDAEVFALAGEPTPPRDTRPHEAIGGDVANATHGGDGDAELTAFMARVGALPDAVRPKGLSPRPGLRARRWRRPVR